MGKLGIVLLHGFKSTPLFMKGIEYELKKWGKLDQILNLSLYGSKWGIFPDKYNLSTPIIRLEHGNPVIDDSIIEHVLQQLVAEVDPTLDSIILLGHSMGGLVWRALYKAYLHDHRSDWLGKKSPKIVAIIQLATPNQGSQLTNMQVIKLFDKMHTDYILKFAGFSINLINRFNMRLHAKSSDEKVPEIDLINQTTEIEQMQPNSEFLQWLNSSPTYVDEIPHFRTIGTRNGVVFTNLAWMENPDGIDQDDIIDEIRDEVGDDNLDEILEQIDINNDDSLELDELKNYLEDHDLDINLREDENISSQIQMLFNQDNFIPNDGLVSIEDAELPGSIFLDLGEDSPKISHHSVCMWFLPFKPYRKVRDLVIETISQFLDSN